MMGLDEVMGLMAAWIGWNGFETIVLLIFVAVIGLGRVFVGE